ncbi:rCG54749, partial [Rattus norvegicus]
MTAPEISMASKILVRGWVSHDYSESLHSLDPGGRQRAENSLGF